jgi:hypothetical protein
MSENPELDLWPIQPYGDQCGVRCRAIQERHSWRYGKAKERAPPKAPQMRWMQVHWMHMSHRFVLACINRAPLSPVTPPLVSCSAVSATTPRSGASRPPRTRRRRRGRRAKRRQQVRALAAHDAGRGGLPHLVGRQVEKVRQCEQPLSLCRQHSPTPVWRDKIGGFGCCSRRERPRVRAQGVHGGAF